MNQIQIIGENNQHVNIILDRVLGVPDSTTFTGGYDVDGSIAIKSGSFSASGSLWFSTGELFNFYNELKIIYDNCIGEAKLINFEANFEMCIKIENRGRVEIEGRYKEILGIDNELTFFFESDQSFLVKTLEDLFEIRKKYGGMKGIKDT
jgi:hypothetical protein